MATAAQVSQFRSDQLALSRLAINELSTFWNALDKSRPDVRDLLASFMVDLVSAYGDVAAGQAAEWFDDVREASVSARGAYRAVTAPPLPAEQIAASTGWALTTREVIPNLEGLVDRLVKQFGRDTLAWNAVNDTRARFARVPSGTETCAFCLMLASRGAVYGDRKSAGDGVKFHSHCDCVITPAWSADDLPDGYDPDALYATYRAGAREAANGDAKSVLAGIRQVTGHSH